MRSVILKNDSEMVLTYAESFIEQTRLDLQVIEKSFFKIGFRLNEAKEHRYFEVLGYEDIYELAESQFGFKKTTTKNLMEVNMTYSTGAYGQPTMEMDERFKGFSQTQLVEMLPMQAFNREHVPPTFTARDIRDYKKITAVDFEWKTLGAESCMDVQRNPAKYVKIYREKKASGEIVEEKPERKMEEYGAEEHTRFMRDLDRLIKPKKCDDVAPGQISMEEAFPEEMGTGRRRELDDALLEGEEIFVQRGGDLAQIRKTTMIIDEASAAVDAKYSQSTDQKLLNLKNDDERQAFIENIVNYPVVVLRNEELGLTVRRCDLANGAKIYRTEYYVQYVGKPDLAISFRLIPAKGQSSDVNGCIRTFSKTWSTGNDGVFSITQYLKHYRNEI